MSTDVRSPGSPSTIVAGGDLIDRFSDDAGFLSNFSARLFDPLDIAPERPERLRVDRLLDEAQHTRDPVQLMRVFGLSKTTAIKYVTTAHPELFIADPTMA